VTWRIFATPSTGSDFARLTDAERAALNENLFAWVETGSPCQTARTLLGFEVFEGVVIRISHHLLRQRSRNLRRYSPHPTGVTSALSRPACPIPGIPYRGATMPPTAGG